MKNNHGFTYIELIISMAIFLIILIPIIPALNQAISNHRYAVLRRYAQGQAVLLTSQVRTNLDDVATVVQNMYLNSSTSNNFTYRVTISQINAVPRYYSSGSGLIPSANINFYTDFENIFTQGIFIIAEVFDKDGNLAGLSVVKAN